jgi:hypothetical protein
MAAGLPVLFSKQLTELLAWAKTGSLFEHQRKLTYLYLERNDPVRTAIFGFKAMVTKECQHSGYDVNDFDAGRKPAADALDAQIRAGRIDQDSQAA